MYYIFYYLSHLVYFLLHFFRKFCLYFSIAWHNHLYFRWFPPVNFRFSVFFYWLPLMIFYKICILMLLDVFYLLIWLLPSLSRFNVSSRFVPKMYRLYIFQVSAKFLVISSGSKSVYMNFQYVSWHFFLLKYLTVNSPFCVLDVFSDIIWQVLNSDH